MKISSSARRIYAAAYLAFCGALFILARLWPFKRKKGYEQFLQNYAAEGLHAFSPSFREQAARVGDCTACGLCDLACATSAQKNLDPMSLVLSVFRGGPLLEASQKKLESMAAVDCASCRQCELACPQQIPIIELAQAFYQHTSSTKQ